jgi:hypothetical protein
MVEEAAQNKKSRLDFTEKDFSGPHSIVYFHELTELQKQSKKSGGKSMLRDIELDFHYEDVERALS